MERWVAVVAMGLTVVASRAQAQEATASVGLSLSSGLGESPVSPAFRVALEGADTRAAVFFDASKKLESGRGWIAGGELDRRAIGPLTVGADYHLRNGGAWQKNVLSARLGLVVARGANVTRLTYRQELATGGGVESNAVSALQVSVRRSIRTAGVRLAVEPGLSLVRYSAYDGTSHVGVVAQLWLGASRAQAGSGTREGRAQEARQ